MHSPQRYISARAEEDLQAFGESAFGVGYRDSRQAAERYEVMLGVVRERQQPVSLLDLGCGLAHLLDYIEADPRWRNVAYTGVDISSSYLDLAARRHPEANLDLVDVLDPRANVPDHDYVVLNHLFNWRGELSRPEMVGYWQRMLSVAFALCRVGIAFNVMSKIVDWERDDLFHVGFDELALFLSARLSRHFVIRHDYGEYEYTTYVYRSPAALAL